MQGVSSQKVYRVGKVISDGDSDRVVANTSAFEAIYRSEIIAMIKQSDCAADTDALRLGPISIGKLAIRATMLHTVHCLCI
jgi:hypothetical protein